MGEKRPDIKSSISRISQHIDEINNYARFKAHFLKNYNDLNSKYQKSSMTYKDYKHKLDKLLSGKTKQDWISYYDSYILLLYRKIDFYNDIIKTIITNDDLESSYKEPDFVKEEFIKLTEKQQEKIEKLAKNDAKNLGLFSREDRHEFLKTIEKSKLGITKKYPTEQLDKMVKVEEKVADIDIGVSKEVKEKVSERRTQIRKGKTNIDINDFKTEEDVPEDSNVGVESFWKRGLLGKIFNMFFKDKIDTKSFLSKDVSVGTSLLSQERMARLSDDGYYEKNKIETNLLTQESIKLRNIIRGREKNKRNTYMIGTVANMLVRNISGWIIKTFPTLFEILYNGIRLANIKILSNTYVNIMVLSTIVSFVAGTILSFGVFSVFGLPFIIVLVRSIFMGLVLSVITGATFYGYPFNRIKERRKNIKTNLSFAISHMAAVAGSGVSPFNMFQLLAQSPEYGEVTIEIQKIVDFCNLFGYDLIVSIKTVAATCPSAELKEFLSGLVSSIDSGGELKAYLIEKSKEALTNYQLERAKFNEVISTYSDIYTGILIAAPLFFVSSLSLVGMLGGDVGGIEIKYLIGIGIYMVIPFMNIAFITFLEMSQPEV